MRLTDIIRLFKGDLLLDPGPNDAEVSGIYLDSREVKKGGVFVALQGENLDGRTFAGQAASKGAVAVISGARIEGISVPQIIVRDARSALSRLSCEFFGRASDDLCVIGVTGTNGKTTVTYIIESILREAGLSPGVIGTVNYRFNGRTSASGHTTPEAPHLHSMLDEMRKAGVTHCVMEVSSHSIAQKRVEDVGFRAAVFTNLTHEHLDYHRTMDGYYEAKSMLFKRLLKGMGPVPVVNMDCPWGRRLAAELSSPLRYSLRREGVCVYPKDYRLGNDRTEATIATPGGDVDIASGLVGEYNLQNILASVSLAIGLGIDKKAVENGIASLKTVPGRLEKIGSGRGGFTAYVDYAHTGDALERALTALRAVARARVITVFGCGGNRDRKKRPEMGGVSTRLSDISIITSDNPRDEDPLEIIREIEDGIEGVPKFRPEDSPLQGYTVIPDRGCAIKKAVSLAMTDDIILVAGKGHEDYQIVKGVKYPFSDLEALKREINGRQGCRVAS
jgi:UDP-N-acetylmuramoyl-L-alanyl-D-glutamate--2,6-diaminopimelate ligase